MPSGRSNERRTPSRVDGLALRGELQKMLAQPKPETPKALLREDGRRGYDIAVLEVLAWLGDRVGGTV